MLPELPGLLVFKRQKSSLFKKLLDSKMLTQDILKQFEDKHIFVVSVSAPPGCTSIWLMANESGLSRPRWCGREAPGCRSPLARSD